MPIPTKPNKYTLNLVTLLQQIIVHGASDLHLATNLPPMARIHGEILPLYEEPLAADQIRDLVTGVLSQAQRAVLEEKLELDFAIEVRELGRFRGNVHFSRGHLEAAFRHIPDQIPSLETLGHRPTIYPLLDLRRGLVLVTGMTGSGKSTTLAAMVQEIAQRRAGVIITIEDPVEYHIRSARSIVKQRQVGQDTHGFAPALQHVLRQDPDVILLGEMRDPETISAALTATETGHLVLSTLHTLDAPKAIDRIVDAFPPHQQSQVLAQLANCLEAILSQRLLPRADGQGRVLATELLVANFAVRATIRERRWEQLVGLLEIGAKDGMNTIDESVGELYGRGLITATEARQQARDPQQMEQFAARYRA